ncbi:MAG: lipoate--protein ligase family protein [Coriobacteriia bacterium]|nr:lipoate--protein ligase family protein [Coriobacteriia bacterium]
MNASWRLLIDDGPADGAWNMALDRAVQVCREKGGSPPTLRLYRWIRPTVTLGRFQSADGVDMEVCATSGIDVVRRFTGGRGVLHDDELTYSIVAGTADGVPRGTAASYRMLCEGLVEAYRALGVEASLTARPRGDGSSAACYLHATAADLSLGALKLSGSAQVWHGSTVLQHGSFTLSRDVAREAQVFRLAGEESKRLMAETATIEQSLQRRPTDAELCEAVVAGVSRGLSLDLEPGVISESERALASELLPETDARTLPRRSNVRTST